MAASTKLDRHDYSKVQSAAGVPNGSTPGNVYIDTTNNNLYIKFGSSWTIVTGATGLGLQNSYDTVATITESAGSGQLTFTAPNSSNLNALSLVQSDTTNNPTVLKIANAGTGYGIEFTTNGSIKYGSSSSLVITNGGSGTGSLGLYGSSVTISSTNSSGAFSVYNSDSDVLLSVTNTGESPSTVYFCDEYKLASSNTEMCALSSSTDEWTAVYAATGEANPSLLKIFTVGTTLQGVYDNTANPGGIGVLELDGTNPVTIQTDGMGSTDQCLLEINQQDTNATLDAFWVAAPANSVLTIDSTGTHIGLYQTNSNGTKMFSDSNFFLAVDGITNIGADGFNYREEASVQTGGAYTSALFDLSSTKTLDSGTISINGAFTIKAPTYEAGGVLTISNNATLYIDAPPTDGANVTSDALYSIYTVGNALVEGSINASGVNGAFIHDTFVVSAMVSEVVTITGGATDSTAFIPAGLLRGILVLVTRAPGGGATTFDVCLKGAGDTNQLIDDCPVGLGNVMNSDVNAKSTTTFPIRCPAAIEVTITPDSPVTSGSLKVSIIALYSYLPTAL